MHVSAYDSRTHNSRTPHATRHEPPTTSSDAFVVCDTDKVVCDTDKVVCDTDKVVCNTDKVVCDKDKAVCDTDNVVTYM